MSQGGMADPLCTASVDRWGIIGCSLPTIGRHFPPSSNYVAPTQRMSSYTKKLFMIMSSEGSPGDTKRVISLRGDSDKKRLDAVSCCFYQWQLAKHYLFGEDFHMLLPTYLRASVVKSVSCHHCEISNWPCRSIRTLITGGI
jgi:hypothetical protein